jgi:hypothetical protein
MTPIQQIMLGSGAAGESYWIKSIIPDGNSNMEMGGWGISGKAVMSANGTDDGAMYCITGSASQSYPTNKDGTHIFKFDKDGTILAKKSFFWGSGYQGGCASMDSDGNMYIGHGTAGRMVKLNSSLVEQARLDTGKAEYDQNCDAFNFVGNYIHIYSPSKYEQSEGSKNYQVLNKSNLEPQDFGSSGDNSRGMTRFNNPGPWTIKDGKLYIVQVSNYIGNSSYHDLLSKWDMSWNNASFPMDKNNDRDWHLRLSKPDGSTGHTSSNYTKCLFVDDSGNVYTAGPMMQYGTGNGWVPYGSRNQFSKLNSSGTVQWFSNIERSADGDGIFDWDMNYGEGGPLDINVNGNILRTLCYGKNNTQTNKSGDKRDLTIAKLNASTGAYISSYSICNETKNIIRNGGGRSIPHRCLWTDTAVYVTCQIVKSGSYGERLWIMKLPVDGGINGTYTLDSQTIKISGNSLSQGDVDSSKKTWTSSGSNDTDYRSGMNDTASSTFSQYTYHTASYTAAQLDL